MRCLELEIIRKRGSKEAYRVFYTLSVRKPEWFVTLTLPLGIWVIPYHLLIYGDDTGFYLKSYAISHGRGRPSYCDRCPSHYKVNQYKLNVSMAIKPGNMNFGPNIDGLVGQPRRWIPVTQKNYDQWVFVGFLDMVLWDIEDNSLPNSEDDMWCIFWDNLILH